MLCWQLQIDGESQMSRPMQAEQDQYEMEVRSANIVSVDWQDQLTETISMYTCILHVGCSVQPIQIGKREIKQNIWINTSYPRCRRWKQLGARHSYVCRRGHFVVEQTSFRCDVEAFVSPVTWSEQIK